MLALNVAKFQTDKIVFVSSKRGKLTRAFQDSGSKVYVIKRRLPIDPFYINNLYRISRKQKAKIIHAHQLLEALNAIVLSFFTGQKVFLSYHGFRYFELHPVFTGIAFLLLRKIRGSFFVSKYLKEYYENKYPGYIKNASVLYNGLPEVLPTRNNEKALREELQIGPKAFVFGMLGNFCEARDHLLIVEAFALLKKKYPEKQLHLVFIGGKDKGDSPWYNRVVASVQKKELEHSVHFAGSRENASALLHNFDVFVYASHRETFCLSMVEAIFAGLPVVVNDFPVLEEVSLNGKLAYLYKTGNVKALVEKLEYVMQHYELCKDRAKENAQKAIKLYSIESHLHNLFEKYNQTA